MRDPGGERRRRPLGAAWPRGPPPLGERVDPGRARDDQAPHQRVRERRTGRRRDHGRGRGPGRGAACDNWRNMTELLLGTKKGLIVMEGDAGTGEFEVRCRAFPGEPVDFAMRDPASGRILATVTSPFYGPKIWFADDPAGEWTQAEG